jgi:hypothetical protein
VEQKILCTTPSSCILNGNFLKLCMLVYYHMKNCILLPHLIGLFLKDLLPLFTLNISSQTLYMQILHFKHDFLKTLHAYVLPCEELHIVSTIPLEQEQSRKLAPDRRTASDKFPGGPVVFVNSPDRLSGKLFCQPLPLRIDKSRFSVNST